MGLGVLVSERVGVWEREQKALSAIHAGPSGQQAFDGAGEPGAGKRLDKDSYIVGGGSGIGGRLTTDEQHGHRSGARMGSKRRAESEPIEFWQVHISNDAVWRPGTRLVESSAPILHFHNVPARGEATAEIHMEDDLVAGNQNSDGFISAAGWRALWLHGGPQGGQLNAQRLGGFSMLALRLALRIG